MDIALLGFSGMQWAWLKVDFRSPSCVSNSGTQAKEIALTEMCFSYGGLQESKRLSQVMQAYLKLCLNTVCVTSFHILLSKASHRQVQHQWCKEEYFPHRVSGERRVNI